MPSSSSSSSTVFIAVQCCQCSTMQVKQQKKSSNKWTCVVCNQKQSVRKVFAQGFMAKDLRKFVQSFNMSRKFTDDCQQYESLTPVTSNCDSGLLDDHRRKRRSDWSEYLDPEEYGSKENVRPEDEGGEFKKPKLRNQASVSANGDGDGDLYKPVFSKRKINQEIVSQGKEEKTYQLEQRTVQPTMATKASKWNAYISNGDNNVKVGSGRNFAGDMGQCSHDILETILDDQKVEDDIHPDFM